METKEMNRDILIAILVSIKQVAENNKEIKTAEHINNILKEIKK